MSVFNAQYAFLLDTNDGMSGVGENFTELDRVAGL